MVQVEGLAATSTLGQYLGDGPAAGRGVDARTIVGPKRNYGSGSTARSKSSTNCARIARLGKLVDGWSGEGNARRRIAGRPGRSPQPAIAATGRAAVDRPAALLAMRWGWGVGWR